MFFEKTRWVTDKFILIMLGLFPLFVGFTPQAYNHITEMKYNFFVIATVLWLAAVLVLVVLALAKGEKYPVQVRPAHIAVAVFLALGAISMLLSEYGFVCLKGADRNDGYLSTLLYAVIFFGVSLFASPKPRYAWALGISTGICCAIALIQRMGYDPLSFYPTGTNYFDKYGAYNGAFLGTIGNVGLLAAYLCISAPLLVEFGLLSKGKWDSFLLLPGVMALIVLALCDVDAGIVAMAGCLLVSVPMLIRSRQGSRIAAGISGGVTLAGLGALYFWPGQSGTLWELSEVLHGRLSDEFGSHRGQIWKNGWELFRQKPWFGGGPGTTSLRFDITWRRYVEALGKDRVVSVENAHNVYLGYLINWGVFALLSYLAAIVCSLVTWWQRRAEGALYPALGSAFLCYMIQDFFGLGLPLTAPLIWVIWGLLESAPEKKEEEEEDDDEPLTFVVAEIRDEYV